MTVHEPATLVTDLLLGGFAGWLAWRLRGAMPAANLAARWWSAALALTAVSALVGGLYHGFALNFAATVVRVWWSGTLLTICLMSAAMALSLLHEAVPSRRQGLWRLLIVAKLAVGAIAAMVHPRFVVVIADYGLTLLVWAAVAFALARPWRREMLAGVGLSGVAAVVQQMRWGVSAQFNHNDVYHVIQAAALFLFYRAARKFGSGAAPGIVAGS